MLLRTHAVLYVKCKSVRSSPQDLLLCVSVRVDLAASAAAWQAVPVVLWPAWQRQHQQALLGVAILSYITQITVLS